MIHYSPEKMIPGRTYLAKWDEGERDLLEAILIFDQEGETRGIKCKRIYYTDSHFVGVNQLFSEPFATYREANVEVRELMDSVLKSTITSDNLLDGQAMVISEGESEGQQVMRIGAYLAFITEGSIKPFVPHPFGFDPRHNFVGYRIPEGCWLGIYAS